MQVSIHGCTDIGAVRKNNEDRFVFAQLNFGLMAVVCDGMGGHEGGEVAAQIAADNFSDHFKSLEEPFNVKTELINSFKLANENIIKAGKADQKLEMMGTTASMLLIKDLKYTIANIGDSRIYRIRQNEISLLTTDHTRLQQIMTEKNISYEQAILLEDKNTLTRVLGINDLSQPDISRPQAVEQGDIFILCSDGLTNYVHDFEMLDIILDCEPEKACEQLIFLANLRHAQDNITVVICKVEKL